MTGCYEASHLKINLFPFSQSPFSQTAERIGHNKAAVALANKLVRICWAVWCHERRFSGNWHSTKPA